MNLEKQITEARNLYEAATELQSRAQTLYLVLCDMRREAEGANDIAIINQLKTKLEQSSMLNLLTTK